MTRDRVYLDHNASTPLRPQARAAVLETLDRVGNASAVHAEGRAARRVVEAARREVATLVGGSAERVVFTSGGSEGAAHLLAPGFKRRGRAAERLIVGAVEHSAVLAGGRFARADIAIAPATRDGVVALDGLEALLAADPRPALVAVMLANNETGIVQPVRAAAELVHAHGGALVCDAVQGPGKMSVDLDALGADALILSGHKLGAPQGVGAVVLAEGVEPVPLVTGGGQERRRRAGTENVSGIAGLGAAISALRDGLDGEIARVSALRDWMEGELATICPEAVVIGAAMPRLANTSSIALPGASAETAVIALDLAGIAIAAGAACSSGKVGPSHVLAAMGVDPVLARATIRVSLGWSTTKADLERFLAAFLQRREATRPRAA
jgi:cysteine desulfurase